MSSPGFLAALAAGGQENGKWISGQLRADTHSYLVEPGIPDEPLEFIVVETEPPVAQALLHPRFVVPAEVEDEEAPARHQDTSGFRERLRHSTAHIEIRYRFIEKRVRAA